MDTNATSLNEDMQTLLNDCTQWHYRFLSRRINWLGGACRNEFLRLHARANVLAVRISKDQGYHEACDAMDPVREALTPKQSLSQYVLEPWRKVPEWVLFV